MSVEPHIERGTDGYYVRHDVQSHGPFRTIAAAAECLEQLRAELRKTAEIRRRYAAALRTHNRLFKRRDPDRAARIRAELAGFVPPAPPTAVPSTTWPPAPTAEPTAENVHKWQTEARTAANRFRRAKVAKQRQAAATTAARPAKAAKAAATEAHIRECWNSAADVPARRRAAHVATLLGVTPQHVRRVLKRT